MRSRWWKGLSPNLLCSVKPVLGLSRLRAMLWIVGLKMRGVMFERALRNHMMMFGFYSKKTVYLLKANAFSGFYF